MDIDKWIKEAEHKAGLASENNRLDDMHYNRGIADCLKLLKKCFYGIEERKNKLTKLTDVIAEKHSEAALTIATEECAELIQAITKLKRGSVKNIDNLSEEIADVLICIDWVKRIYGVSESDVNHWVDYKINRCNERLANGTFR